MSFGNLLTQNKNVKGITATDNIITPEAQIGDLRISNQIVGGNISATNITCLTLDAQNIIKGGSVGNDIYVSKTGNDIVGDGSLLNPFLTIQKAIDTAEALVPSSSNRFIIRVGVGSYNENLTFTSGYTTLLGDSGTFKSSNTIITGNISLVGANAEDLFNCIVAIQGFTILGDIVDTKTNSHTLNITNCNIYYADRGVYQNSTGADSRTSIFNTSLNSSNDTATDPAIEVANGWLDMVNCRLSTEASRSLIVASGTGVIIRAIQVILESFRIDPVVPPIVDITSTSTTPHSFGQVLFSYNPASPVKTNPDAGAVNLNNSNTTILFTDNFCALYGVVLPNTAIVVSGGNPNVVLGQNTSIPGFAFGVGAGATTTDFKLWGGVP